MTLAQILTLVIAIYGAVISTVLAVRAVRQDRRRVLIILEYVAFYERAQIVIVNIGHRPITIADIGMYLQEEQSGNLVWSMVPRNALFDAGVQGEPEQHLPVPLTDGEHITIPLSRVVSERLLANRMKAHLCVYDTEGKAHRTFKTRLYNPKWGHYSELSS